MDTVTGSTATAAGMIAHAPPAASLTQSQNARPSTTQQQQRGGSSGGRHSTSGRGLVHPTTAVPTRAPQPSPTPTAIHQHSGIPHGHVPAYLPGSASVVEELDSRLLIVLRDGKHIVGVRTGQWCVIMYYHRND
jgi:hypothetical protein